KVVELDTDYIKKWSLRLDLKILLKTFKVVFKKEGSM
ncbi:MAG: sugar transferase, partial [Clostridia bacterium]|nr:sugar transferase [Clostridia bacterium]